jgi:transcriptional regulator with XRE-family HTH domain
MLEEDLRSLRQILGRAVDASGIQRRDVERALKLRNGTLGKLLDGTMDLRVEHLTALARLLKVPPGDFLRLGCPQTRAAATYRLTDWLGPQNQNTAPAPPAAYTPPTPEELVEMIRAVVREELDARKGKTGES